MKRLTWQWPLLSCALLSCAVVAGCGGGSGGGLGNGQATPTPGAGTPAGPTPISGTPTPLASRTLTLISASGTLGVAGRFTQTQGTYDTFTGIPRPGMTAEPTPTPQTVPPGTATTALYTGTYTLNTGETGEFNLTVSPDNTASIVAVPPDFFTFEMQTTPTRSGSATVTLQLNGATGSGTIRLSNGVTGTINITGRTQAFSHARTSRLRH